MEKWLPIVGYENFYEISDQGRVKTVARLVPSKCGSIRHVSERIRSANGRSNGYPVVNLSIRNKVTTRTIHVMMLEAFIGPRPSPLHDACHENDQREDNRLENLRWDTKKANKEDAFKNGKAPHGEKVGLSKLTKEQAIKIFHDHRNSKIIAAEYSVNKSTITKLKRGKTWARSLADHI